jgi:two-component system cell cycle response regulator
MENKTVLIVDDDELNIKLIKAMLKSENYRLLAALSGMECLEMVADVVPDLILLDVMMPGIDGFEVCRRIKQEGETRKIPIIMVSSSIGEKLRVEAMEAGADGFLSKPVDKTELVVQVKSLLLDKK